jgi:hypothetical protein
MQCKSGNIQSGIVLEFDCIRHVQEECRPATFRPTNIMKTMLQHQNVQMTENDENANCIF